MLSLFGGGLAFLIGLILALAKMSPIKWLSVPASVFIEIIRGTPLLLQIFVVYFGVVPLFIRQPDGFFSALIALAINAGAYMAETFRAGIQSVPKEQMEAARSLGLTWFDSMRYVIWPQAFRNALPSLGNSLISMIKDSSLASVIATPELMYWANAANAQYYRIWETFITTAIVYFMLTFILSRIILFLENRLRF